MAIHDGRVSIAPGEGLVARATSTILVVRATSPAPERMLDELLTLTTGQQAVSGRRSSAGWPPWSSSRPGDDVPDLGLVTASSAGDVLVLPAGDVRLTAAADGTPIAAHGLEATTYVERVLPRSTHTLTVALSGSTEPDPRSVLGQGVVRGDGFRLEGPPRRTREPRPRGRAAPPPPTPWPRPATRAALAHPPAEPLRDDSGVHHLLPARRRAWLRGGRRPSQAMPHRNPARTPARPPVQVRGVACSRR